MSLGCNPISKPALTATAALLIAGRSTLSWAHVDNTNASKVYLQVFDAASAGAVTLGTTVPVLSFGISASSSQPIPLSDAASFANGIVVAITTTPTGLTAPGAACPSNFGVRSGI